MPKFRLQEEWPDKENPYRFHYISIFAGPFETRQEAEEEMRRRKPQHADGHIRVIEEKPQHKPVRKIKRRRRGPLRDDRRRDRRR